MQFISYLTKDHFIGILQHLRTWIKKFSIINNSTPFCLYDVPQLDKAAFLGEHFQHDSEMLFPIWPLKAISVYQTVFYKPMVFKPTFSTDSASAYWAISLASIWKQFANKLSIQFLFILYYKLHSYFCCLLVVEFLVYL